MSFADVSLTILVGLALAVCGFGLYKLFAGAIERDAEREKIQAATQYTVTLDTGVTFEAKDFNRFSEGITSADRLDGSRVWFGSNHIAMIESHIVKPQAEKENHQ